ncbi:hypothetical protein AB0I53_29920 [Saccharopolyspora sp. NPDC050389]|uniref:hypothetical protein n=1 Tax=Saccharopolyspora sp. NPDC050389 TaxID=3155516 RepID=UPI0033C32CA2
MPAPNAATPNWDSSDRQAGNHPLFGSTTNIHDAYRDTQQPRSKKFAKGRRNDPRFPTPNSGSIARHHSAKSSKPPKTIYRLRLVPPATLGDAAQRRRPGQCSARATPPSQDRKPLRMRPPVVTRINLDHAF